MQVLLWAEDSEAELRAEIERTFPGVALSPRPSLVEADLPVSPGQSFPHLVFARQWLPEACSVNADSVRAWASQVADAVIGVLNDNQPWALHVEPHYAPVATHRIGARAWHTAKRHGEPVGSHSPNRAPQVHSEAGRHRCALIREAVVELLQRKRRHLLRNLRRGPAPFTPADSLVQALLTRPDAGFISVAAAPLPFEQRHLLSLFPKGEVPVAPDKAAPSRAFAKLVEAELRLGLSIQANETCVDLGAAPGSWTYVAAHRGARVVAIDRSPLREDLMSHRRVRFDLGDAFEFKPSAPVDWLLCDVIAAPERTAALLLEWLRRGWCRRFVVTIKLKDTGGWEVLEELKREMLSLTREFRLCRLNANKKEVCAFGTGRDV